MKISITGVAGFIGSNLALTLLDRGYSIVGIDNMSQGCDENLDDFRDHPNFSFYKINVQDEMDFNCEYSLFHSKYRFERGIHS